MSSSSDDAYELLLPRYGPASACVRALAWRQAVALIGRGGLLEATDAKGKMAAEFLPKTLVLALLARVKHEEQRGGKGGAKGGMS